MTDEAILHVVTTRGSGATVVFLHGLGGTHRYWAAGLDGTSAHCVLVDLLGFGDSPKPWRRYSVDAHLEALERTLCPHRPFVLVGHSMGAVLALALAARRPDLVHSLGLLSLPCYGSQADAYRWVRRAPGGWLYTNIFAAALACMITRRLAGRLLPYLVRDFPRVVVEDLVKHHFLSFTTSLWKGFDQDKAEMSSCCANYLILCDFYKLSLCLYKTTAYRASSCGNLLKQGSHL